MRDIAVLGVMGKGISGLLIAGQLSLLTMCLSHIADLISCLKNLLIYLFVAKEVIRIDRPRSLEVR